ncbi:MAG: TlpA family protein disulfide reductase [Proteobacteria bacterium]|nr:TlpA family protein disulfide reductase [Pseudomonadota bacterium]
MKRILLLAFALALACPVVRAQAPQDADNLLENLIQLAQPLKPPAEWAGRIPSAEELAAFRAKQAESAGVAADLAADFLKRFPAHAKAAEVREQQHQLLTSAVQKGATKRVEQLDKLEEQILADPKLTDEDKFRLRMRTVDRRAGLKQSEGMAVMLAEFEKGARALQKEFPERKEVFEMLYAVAMRSDGPKAAAIAKEIAASSADPQVKEAAAALLKKSERIGKPIKLEFTAVDGRKVDLAKLKGKVVLIDFWATWCGPCVAELPNVKAAYAKLNPKGFEVIGISLDDDKAALLALVKHKQLPWPQFFESEKDENRYAKQFDISAIPAMWLVDKQGNLVDTNARDGLEKKVEQLLEEKPAAK